MGQSPGEAEAPRTVSTVRRLRAFSHFVVTDIPLVLELRVIRCSYKLPLCNGEDACDRWGVEAHDRLAWNKTGRGYCRPLNSGCHACSNMATILLALLLICALLLYITRISPLFAVFVAVFLEVDITPPCCYDVSISFASPSSVPFSPLSS